MKIGDLARRADCAVQTIRFYEQQGLLSEPQRTPGNYRVYDPAHVQELAFIRHCRSLDMALDEIRSLLAFRSSPAAHHGRVHDLLEEHIGHVGERITALRSLERELKSLLRVCLRAKEGHECGILDRLGQRQPRDRGRRHAHVGGVHAGKKRRAATVA